MIDALPVLVFVTLQRLIELLLSARNTARLKARGAYEVGAAHYPVMIALHAAWLGGLWYLALPLKANGFLLALYVLLQIVRIWIVMTLNDRWTTRIIIVPGEGLVKTGPYRILNHPNYFVVAAEIALLPLVFGLVAYAAIFATLNAALLLWRIHVEDGALARR
jgi:methyltransferase